MKALPARFYRDPADVADELRTIRERVEPRIARTNTLSRAMKSLRIRSLVAGVMKGKGGERGGR